MFRLPLLFAATMVLAGTVAAQRYVSPPANASVTIAGKKITVDYYAPSLHGRKMLGNFVPYGRVWCPGANVATGLTTPVDLQFGTLKLPKGTWSIWAIPQEKEWTLIINKQSGQHHLDYDQAEDFGRIKVNAKTIASPVETLRFELNANGGNKGTLALMWETTEVSVPFTLLP
jgi:hypothetical protein